MAPEKIGPGDFDPTLGAPREGVVRVARDKALREVDGWEGRLRASGDRELLPAADDLARLRTELQRDPLDGVAIAGLLETLSGRVRHVAAEGTEGGSAGPVAGRLEDPAKLLEAESRSVREP